MSSNSRMTRSKGLAEEVSLPPTRMRKGVSAVNEGKDKAQKQVQANVQSQQQTTDTPSPFARPGSWAGTSTTPASEAGCSRCPAIRLHGHTAAQVSRHRNQHHHTHHHCHL